MGIALDGGFRGFLMPAQELDKSALAFAFRSLLFRLPADLTRVVPIRPVDLLVGGFNRVSLERRALWERRKGILAKTTEMAPADETHSVALIGCSTVQWCPQAFRSAPADYPPGSDYTGLGVALAMLGQRNLIDSLFLLCFCEREKGVI